MLRHTTKNTGTRTSSVRRKRLYGASLRKTENTTQVFLPSICTSASRAWNDNLRDTSTIANYYLVRVLQLSASELHSRIEQVRELEHLLEESHSNARQQAFV